MGRHLMATNLVWVSVGRDVEPVTAEHRHLVAPGYRKRGYVTTACGSTGSPGVWRANHSKPKCPRCVAEADSDTTEGDPR